MENQRNLQPMFRQKAMDILRLTPPQERESTLIKCWMSHDARWFMAVAAEYGMQAANRLNQTAAREVGKVEARRILGALDLLPAKSLDDCLLFQEILISFAGPDLIEYDVVKTAENSYQVLVHRCFAHENVERAGVAGQYECGIFARVNGWFDTFGLSYSLTPPLGKCLKVQGRECRYSYEVNV